MILVNGKTTDMISVNDRGFLYGDGLFETILIKDSKIFYLEEHLQRLFASCMRLKISPPDKKTIVSEIQSITKGFDKVILKIIVTRGNSDNGLKVKNSAPNRVLRILPYPARIEKNIQQGISLKICDTRLSSNPATSGMKLLNWLEPVLANMELGDRYQEGLMLDHDGFIIEGTVSNFFCVQDNKILTPDLETCGLPGTMRAKIIQTVESLGCELTTAKIRLSDLDKFSGFFTSNSLGIYPVIRIGKKRYKKPQVVKKLQQQLF